MIWNIHGCRGNGSSDLTIGFPWQRNDCHKNKIYSFTIYFSKEISLKKSQVIGIFDHFGIHGPRSGATVKWLVPRFVGDFMMVTDWRYWWQNHYVGDFFHQQVTNILNRSATFQTSHQHILSPSSVNNINVTVKSDAESCLIKGECIFIMENRVYASTDRTKYNLSILWAYTIQNIVTILAW